MVTRKLLLELTPRFEEEDFIERVPSASGLQTGPRPQASAQVAVSPLFLATHVTTPCGARVLRPQEGPGRLSCVWFSAEETLGWSLGSEPKAC